MKMIVSKIVEVDKIQNITTNYVENELKKRSIKPIRWAIVEIKEKTFTISLACFE